MADTADDADPAPTLAELMARIAAGDGVALFQLLELHRASIRATVVRSLRKLSTRVEVALLDELVAETMLVIRDTAGSWRPEGGALPWVWAERRIHQRISAYIGQHAVELDESLDNTDTRAGVASDRDEDEWQTLQFLAARDERVALLRVALEQVTTVRHRAILLAYEALKTDGDPSPSHTLGEELGLSPANVRQIVRRTKVKVHNLVHSDDRFAAIRDLPILQ
jgi:RNA polymerase sigma factor (sigma-70 family)